VTLVLGSARGAAGAEIPENIDLIELGDARYSALLSLAGRCAR
jgi:hypothetical protein